MIRPLKKAPIGQFNNHNEFNLIRVTNIQAFLDSYTNNIDYYKTAFQILLDLEDKVKYSDNPDNTVSVSYKEEGEVLFDLVSVREINNTRIVEYEFSFYAS